MRLTSLLLGLSIAVAACGGGGSTGPRPTGTVHATVMTTGHQLDPDGYTLHVDTLTRNLPDSGSALIAGLTPGNVQVQVTGIASNCAAVGSATQEVHVVADSTTNASLAVTCDTTYGGLKVVFTTTGGSPDSNGYLVKVDADATARVADSDSLVVRPLSAGSHTLSVTDVASNCSVGGGASRGIAVPAGRDTLVTITVSCVTPTTISVHMVTGGSYFDPNGYNVVLDSGAAHPVSDSGTVGPIQAAPGGHIVYVSGVVANCNADYGASQAVTAIANTDVVDTISISCGPPAIVFSRQATNRVGPGYFQLFLVNPDGTNLTQLTFDSTSDRSARWSVDGKSILYSATGSGSRWETIDPRTKHVFALPPGIAAYSDLGWWTGAGRLVGIPSTGLPRELVAVDSNGGNLVQLTFDTTAAGVPDTSVPGVSGLDVQGATSQVLYGRSLCLSGCKTHLWRVGLIDDSARAVTDSAYVSTDGSWTAIGGTFAFLSTRGGSTEVYTADPLGDHLTQVTNYPSQLKEAPRWSPDGTSLVLSAQNLPSGVPTLFIVDVASGLEVQLLPPLPSSSGDHDPDWRWGP